ncbi:hypothetical protein MUK42_37071 [Musa troglodytarum]|uniref:Uncharacterized protein n=1 Tax=Musa troglodytarum TaxID=320322 RepID=A0A9E7ECS9_9LILI|nr:hypothetical protein MUK42_37071 [Musa troglodytarum]
MDLGLSKTESTSRRRRPGYRICLAHTLDVLHFVEYGFELFYRDVSAAPMSTIFDISTFRIHLNRIQFFLPLRCFCCLRETKTRNLRKNWMARSDNSYRKPIEIDPLKEKQEKRSQFGISNVRIGKALGKGRKGGSEAPSLILWGGPIDVRAQLLWTDGSYKGSNLKYRNHEKQHRQRPEAGMATDKLRGLQYAQHNTTRQPYI